MSNPSQIFASHLVANLAAYGADFWLAPGARSQALAIAAAQVSEVSDSRLFVRIDERSLGFSALGASISNKPQVIITTSGTAVANLHPAVLEAHHSGIPLVLLTADRPASLRDKGANQTTNQVGIFNDAVIECIDVPAPTESYSSELSIQAAELVERAITVATNSKQPIQLNLQFIEPLSDIEPNAAEIFKTLKQISASTPEHRSIAMSLPRETVIIAGANSDQYLAEIEKLNYPIFAEPSSGVRHLEQSVLGYRFVLANQHQLVNEIKQIIVYGKPTLSRPVISLLRKIGIDVLVRKGKMGNFLIPETATVIEAAIENTTGDAAWLESWQSTANELTPKATGEFDRRAIVETVWEAETDVLVLGASQMIREADHFAPRKDLKVWANRGLSGIDGTIATATGIACITGKQVTALMGDLTFLHDASSLVIDPADGEINLRIVIVNDNGGKIFEDLEVAKTAESKIYGRVFKTGQQFEMASIAEGFGWNYVSVSNTAELASALKLTGRALIEIKLA
ncbi:MAG: 2-succinyl-5-enolpyruvyl-6-hydroxy-3-cyclohexene-1-carboxylic-acid synthase [Micrococcales bacterium]|nr:2-succinyl-5-enolpyruvyl-6-hydroxy-3-cyclohexene-1-carboxylic-acid synthase [Micrococcales bacterium]